jgi:G:T-mismatch repair DNA endonuclease (very short patch repair protein)
LIRLCSVNDCNNKHDAKGYCGKHYRKWKKYGDPLISADPEETRKKLSRTSKGRTPWNKGKKQLETTKRKISILTKIALSNPTTKQKMRFAQLGRRHTDETKMKIGSAHLGKKLSKETRRKLSESLKITYANPVLRKQMSERNKGRKATDETKRKMSIARKGKTTGMLGNKHSEETKMKISKKTSGKNNPNYGKKHSDIALEKIRSARDKQVFPRKDSKPELLVQSILLKNNINFTKHFSFKLTRSRHQADLMIEPHKIIEVFGDYWHFNPKHYDGESIQRKSSKSVKVKDVWKYDKYVIDEMRKQGYKVLVVWESELKKEFDKTSKMILKFVKS